jgi:predicted Zn-ribbon and HTH transcriptional regulator
VIKIKCEKCGYEWETKSIKEFVTCPSCLRKIKNKNKTKEVVKN